MARVSQLGKMPGHASLTHLYKENQSLGTRQFNVFERHGRQMDVKTTLCAYCNSINTTLLGRQFNVFERHGRQMDVKTTSCYCNSINTTLLGRRFNDFFLNVGLQIDVETSLYAYWVVKILCYPIGRFCK